MKRVGTLIGWSFTLSSFVLDPSLHWGIGSFAPSAAFAISSSLLRLNALMPDFYFLLAINSTVCKPNHPLLYR